jgi:hypothetical protein
VSLMESGLTFVLTIKPDSIRDTDDHLTAIREAIRSVDPYVPVFGVKTMEQRLEDFSSARGPIGRLFGCLPGLRFC